MLPMKPSLAGLEVVDLDDLEFANLESLQDEASASKSREIPKETVDEKNLASYGNCNNFSSP